MGLGHEFFLPYLSPTQLNCLLICCKEIYVSIVCSPTTAWDCSERVGWSRKSRNPSLLNKLSRPIKGCDFPINNYLEYKEDPEQAQNPEEAIEEFLSSIPGIGRHPLKNKPSLLKFAQSLKIRAPEPQMRRLRFFAGCLSSTSLTHAIQNLGLVGLERIFIKSITLKANLEDFSVLKRLSFLRLPSMLPATSTPAPRNKNYHPTDVKTINFDPDLSFSCISGDLNSLKDLNLLEVLDLSCAIDVTGNLLSLRKLSKLRILQLEETRVEGDISSLASFPKLQEVSLKGSSRVKVMLSKKCSDPSRHIPLNKQAITGCLSSLSGLSQLSAVNVDRCPSVHLDFENFLGTTRENDLTVAFAAMPGSDHNIVVIDHITSQGEYRKVNIRPHCWFDLSFFD